MTDIHKANLPFLIEMGEFTIAGHFIEEKLLDDELKEGVINELLFHKDIMIRIKKGHEAAVVVMLEDNILANGFIK